MEAERYCDIHFHHNLPSNHNLSKKYLANYITPLETTILIDIVYKNIRPRSLYLTSNYVVTLKVRQHISEAVSINDRSITLTRTKHTEQR